MTPGFRGAALGLALTLFPSARAMADETDVCLESHVSAQQSRAEGAPVVALLAAKRCETPGCPEQVRTECALWRRELESILGTIEVTLKAPPVGGTPAIRIDGADPVAPLGGNRFMCTAGKHVVEVTVPGQSPARVEVQVPPGGLARATIDLAPPPTLKPTPPPSDVNNSNTGAPNFTVPGATLVAVGGAGLVAFAVSAGLGLSAYGDLDACRPNCPLDQVEDVDAKFLVADVSLGLGLGVAAVGVVLLILGETSDPETPGPAALRAGPGGFLFRF